MLQIVGVSQSVIETIELDDYTPLVIRWRESDFNPSIYWSLASEPRSLIEIKIDSQVKNIKTFEVILVPKFIYSSVTYINPSLPYQSGVPICKTDNWESNGYFNEGYFRKKGTFDFYVRENSISIALSENSLSSQVVSGRVRFGLDQNNYLCVLEVVDFTEEEMVQLIGTLNHVSQ